MKNKVVKVTILCDDGSGFIIDGQEELKQVLLAFSSLKGINYKKFAAINVLMQKYYAMEDELRKAVASGYTKGEFHDAIKTLVLSHFKDMPNLFKNNYFENSMTVLNSEGFSAAIEQLKSTASDVFNYVFKEV